MSKEKLLLTNVKDFIRQILLYTVAFLVATAIPYCLLTVLVVPKSFPFLKLMGQDTVNKILFAIRIVYSIGIGFAFIVGAIEAGVFDQRGGSDIRRKNR